MAPRRILIVDDNAELAENLAEILRLNGHSTEVAISAEDALARVGQLAPDVVLTDYRLPGIDGASLLRQLHDRGVRASVIVMSAFTDDRTIADAGKVGAAFVPKPVDLVELARLVTK
jgi:DNA-binding NtrC family response regulator